MSQQYSLRWNNHQPNFISMFTTLLNTQTLVDVTLSADGKQLLAHKVVLSACSTYFQSLFVDNPSPHPIVILKDVTYADLRTMVDFMYCGEVNVTEEQLPKVLDTAKLLKIKGLTEMPESTSLTRSQGTSSDFHHQGDSMDSMKRSPAASPSIRRKRRRKSSTASTSHLNMICEDTRPDMGSQALDAITLSSLPQQQQRRIREYHEIRTIDNSQQTTEQDNMQVEQMSMEQAPAGLAPGGQWTMMEHSYPRYSNACIGGSLQPDHGMYMNNMNAHMESEMPNYGQSLGVPGPSPGPSCVDVPAPQEQAQAPAPKRRRTTNPQSEENFQRALEAVRFGGIGFCKAARMFGVNNRTLWLEYKKKGYPNTRPSIKSRIKKEHTTPPPELKDEQQPAEQQMALLCSQHQVPASFVDSTTGHNFSLQGMPHSSPLNILAAPAETLTYPPSPGSDSRQRRSKHFKRQSRVPEDGRVEVRKQTSDPLPPSTAAPRVTPTLQKYESYPQFVPTKPMLTRKPRMEQEIGSLLIRPVSINERHTSTTITTTSASFESTTSDSSQTQRAKHTPAVRSGPPLSCNFCWNTVDECGRILRRKTQYHCPECRTNLCIVPCFHEYHEGPEHEANVNVR